MHQIEGCSGGGGRFDAGMAYYTPQIWASDDSDAIDRLSIQYGTSLVYPQSMMTSHVSVTSFQKRSNHLMKSYHHLDDQTNHHPKRTFQCPFL